MLALSNVPADSRVAWTWLHDVRMSTVHPSLKSIAVVYEYVFPLLLADKLGLSFSL